MLHTNVRNIKQNEEQMAQVDTKIELSQYPTAPSS